MKKFVSFFLVSCILVSSMGMTCFANSSEQSDDKISKEAILKIERLGESGINININNKVSAEAKAKATAVAKSGSSKFNFIKFALVVLSGLFIYNKFKNGFSSNHNQNDVKSNQQESVFEGLKHKLNSQTCSALSSTADLFKSTKKNSDSNSSEFKGTSGPEDVTDGIFADFKSKFSKQSEDMLLSLQNKLNCFSVSSIN